jgi:N-acetylmuramoyl-L-alanine amidase
VYKPTGILLCALAGLAGCQTAPRSIPKERPPDWSIAPAPEMTNAPVPPTNRVPTPVTPPRTSPPPPAVKPRATPETTWLSLNRWAVERGLGKLRRVSVSPVESFALTTTNGALLVSVGSHAAEWDGVEFRLGFAPMIADGQMFVHALDARKNLEPLLGGYVAPTKTSRVIVIDPGHGGSNTGTRSVADGRLEKQFTLDWARRLAELLATNGWQVFLTRSNDVDVSLAERTAIAEQHKADLFLSLHFNSPGAGGREP